METSQTIEIVCALISAAWNENALIVELECDDIITGKHTYGNIYV